MGKEDGNRRPGGIECSIGPTLHQNGFELEIILPLKLEVILGYDITAHLIARIRTRPARSRMNTAK